MKKIQSFDPSQTTSGTISTAQASAGAKLYLINESAYGLDLTLGTLGTLILPPWYALLIPLRAPLPGIDWAQDYLLLALSSPASLVTGFSFDSTEDTTGYTSGPLVRQANVGNAVQVSGSSSLTTITLSGNLSVQGSSSFGGSVLIPNNQAFQTYDNAGGTVNLLYVDANNNTVLQAGVGSGNLILADPSGNTTISITSQTISLGTITQALVFPAYFALRWGSNNIFVSDGTNVQYILPNQSGIHAFYDNQGVRIAHFDSAGVLYCKNVTINSSSPAVTIATGGSVAFINHSSVTAECLQVDVLSNHLCIRGTDTTSGVIFQTNAQVELMRVTPIALDLTASSIPLLLGGPLYFYVSGTQAAITGATNGVLNYQATKHQWQNSSSTNFMSLTGTTLDVTPLTEILLNNSAGIHWYNADNTVDVNVLTVTNDDRVVFTCPGDGVHGGFLFSDVAFGPFASLTEGAFDISLGGATYAMILANSSNIDWFLNDGSTVVDVLQVDGANSFNIYSPGQIAFFNSTGTPVGYVLDTKFDFSPAGNTILLANNVMVQWQDNAAATKNIVGLDSANNILVRMTDAAGANKISFQSSTPAEVAKIDSNGNLTVNTITTSGTGNTAQINAMTVVGAGIGAININTGGITTTTGVKWNNSTGTTKTVGRFQSGTTGSVANGTTITHNLGATPSQVVVTATTGTVVGVSAVGSTTFTIATAGSGLTVHWIAIA